MAAEWNCPNAHVPALVNWWVDVKNPMALPFKREPEPTTAPTAEEPPPAPPPKPKLPLPVVPDSFWYRSSSRPS